MCIRDRCGARTPAACPWWHLRRSALPTRLPGRAPPGASDRPWHNGDVSPAGRALAAGSEGPTCEDATIAKQQEFVLRTIEERDVRFIRLWFTDVLGFLKSVAIAPAELEGAFAEGIGFDGSAVEGFARVTESDMLAKPD